uniref:Serpin peptidase inhibitor, clade A (alpha-1 antiproteinase, antitrypsin), member 1 n=2 Tax=Takifugu rubripes TaxID=31033 RepID=H2SLS0_TAKRU
MSFCFPAQAVKMRDIIASCMLAALLLAVASADHHQHHNHNHQHGPKGHDGEDICHLLSNGNADFGFALYKQLNAKSDAGKNIFFSPLGISSALSVLTKGARGDTRSQLFSTLGYGAFNQSQVDEAYMHLFHMFKHNRGNQELRLGNAAAVDKTFNPLKAYMTDIKDYYSAEVLDVDFKNPAEAAAEINKYIALNTGDMIKDQVKDLDPDTAMVLINYIFFKGEWERPFNSNLTQKMDFNVDESTKVQVDMMRRTGRFDYYSDFDNHSSIIMLPYKGNTSMMIILPNEGKMKHVENSISKEQILHWFNSLFRMSVELMLPKFSISADASLNEVLQEMGVTNVFSDAADLSGISQEPKLKVSKVSHRAVLDVDEKGTTAAASTTIEIMPMSMPGTMKVDRPFLVLILERSTRSILFMGKINNPTAQ